MKKVKTYNQQNGAVSLFAVIFATLLITLVTVGFISIMLKDQQQAVSSNLSQSAYNSALAGVEDAKRAIIRLQSSTGSAYDTFYQQIVTNPTCTSAVTDLTGVNIDGTEVKIESDSSLIDKKDAKYNQAYTCLKIALDTPDYLGVLDNTKSKLIPLVGMLGFNKIKIEWFSAADMSGSSITAGSLSNMPLLASWGSNRPSILRTQLIQYQNGLIKLSDFDKSIATTGASSNTLFLYPTTNSNLSLSFSSDLRGMASVTSSLTYSKCADIASGEYACSQEISLPATFDTSNHTLFLNLMSLYRGAHFRITLYNGADLVKFKAVQPEVDSTGRAGDVFRRVKARIDGDSISDFPYPQAAVDVDGNICKDFAVTGSLDDFADFCPAGISF